MIRPAPKPLRVVLFDLDGTLIDSTELIVSSYEHTYRAHGRAIGREVIEAELGRPLHDTLARYFVGDEFKAALTTYLDFNLKRYDDGVKMMDGIAGLVRRLRKSRLRVGVVTSKLREAAVRGLMLCQLDGAFDVLVAKEDTQRHKPDSEPLLYALAKLDADAREAAYVGDSPLDIEAADGANMRSIAALWRPATAAAFARVQPDAFATTPEEAALILEAWRDGREHCADGEAIRA